MNAVIPGTNAAAVEESLQRRYEESRRRVFRFSLMEGDWVMSSENLFGPYCPRPRDDDSHDDANPKNNSG